MRTRANWIAREQDVVVLPTPPLPPTKIHRSVFWARMEARVGSRGSSSETERLAVVAMVVFREFYFWWVGSLVARVWVELISGCLFFLASDRRRESSRHYLEKVASVYLQSTYQKMAFCMIKTLRLQISRKSHGILLRTINHPYGRRFGYTSYLFKHCLYKHTSIQLPPSLRPNMSALR